VTTGNVTALHQSVTAGDSTGTTEDLSGLIQTNALLRPGDSGGPLTDLACEVVGMNTAAAGARRVRPTGNESYAIPINQAKAIADQIVAGKASAKIHLGLPAFLGVELPDDGGSGAATSGGVVIRGTVPGTPAASSGLVSGDTIVSVDGKPVNSSEEVKAAVTAHRPGDSISVTWRDQSGQQHTTSLRLASGPAD